jgi:hypothetical protein
MQDCAGGSELDRSCYTVPAATLQTPQAAQYIIGGLARGRKTSHFWIPPLFVESEDIKHAMSSGHEVSQAMRIRDSRTHPTFVQLDII